MHRAKYEIEAEQADVVAKAVQIEDDARARVYAQPGVVVLEIETETLKDLMKVSHSMCARIALSMETVQKYAR